MSKRKCPNCGHIYWINVYVDEEYACPRCGYVEEEKVVGQLKGRITITDD